MSPPISTAPAKVGDLATLCYPSDRYPYIVTAVSPSGAKIMLEELKPTADGLSYYAGSFPVWDCAGDPTTRTGRVISAHRQHNGNYAVDGSTPLELGRARYRRDWSD